MFNNKTLISITEKIIAITLYCFLKLNMLIKKISKSIKFF